MVKKKSTDKDKIIKDLKKQLDKLTKEYLKGRKKKMKDPKKYKKVKDNIMKRTGLAQSQGDIEKLIAMLRGGGGGGGGMGGGGGQKPAQPIIQQTPATIGTISDRITPKPKKASKDPTKSWTDMTESWKNLKDRYENDTLTEKDLKDLYKKTKTFASMVDENIPTAENLLIMYGVGRGMYNYLKRFMNNNRPQGEPPLTTTTTTTTPPPTEPPTTPPTDTPPPPTPTDTMDGNNPVVPDITGEGWAQYLLDNQQKISTGLTMGVLAGGAELGRRMMGLRREQRDLNVAVAGLEGRILAEANRRVGEAIGAGVATGLRRAVRDNPLESDRPGLESTEDMREQIQTGQQEVEQAETTLERLTRMGNERGGYNPRPRDGAVGQFRDRDLTNQARGQYAEAEQSQIREQYTPNIPQGLVRGVGGVGDAEAMAEGAELLEGAEPPTERAMRARNRGTGLMRDYSRQTMTTGDMIRLMRDDSSMSMTTGEQAVEDVFEEMGF